MENDSPTGAGEVISQRLVAFRNVAELQEQNTHLRTSLRELSQQMEAVEKEAVENRTQDLQVCLRIWQCRSKISRENKLSENERLGKNTKQMHTIQKYRSAYL